MDRDTFERMQQAAERRVQAQQKKESSYAAGATNKTPDTKIASNTPAQAPSAPKSATGARNQSRELLSLLNLKNISLDSDRALILGIILLLANENADEWLILALIYIML